MQPYSADLQVAAKEMRNAASLLDQASEATPDHAITILTGIGEPLSRAQSSLASATAKAAALL